MVNTSYLLAQCTPTNVLVLVDVENDSSAKNLIMAFLALSKSVESKVQR